MMTPTTEISGHPSVEAHRSNAAPLRITLCAECESVKTVLFLSGDRWFCTQCRNSGDARPTQVAFNNPTRK